MLFQTSKKEEPLILKVSGSPFEMGYQHGLALKQKIQSNIQQYLKKTTASEDSQKTIEQFVKKLPLVVPHIPLKYMDEMKGVSKGSDSSFQDILLLNLFPEMFHCCGIITSGKASKDNTLYHTRVLDYSAGKDLQSSAFLMVASPQNERSFLSVTYAGFIGCVTGMNEAKISIGEIGGLGYGNWDGIPMSFLLRSILEQADSLDEAKEILSSAKRTCEYYYIIADGKTNDSFGCYATSSQIQFLPPGATYSLSPPKNPNEDLSLKIHPTQDDLTLSSLLFHQPADTLLLTGFIAAERYPILEKRVLESYGNITFSSLMEIIKEPVARASNLHNAIFHPSSLRVWISHAGTNNEPACNEPYSCFNLLDLLER